MSLPQSRAHCVRHCFLQWCISRGVKIDEEITLIPHSSGGIGVFSKDKWIESSRTVVYIPKSCVLSVKTCALPVTPVSYDQDGNLDGVLALSLAVYAEVLLSTSSQFYPYLQTLSQSFVDIPVFWDVPKSERLVHNSDLEQDGVEAALMISGTEVEKLLRPNGHRLIDKIRQYYDDVAVPWLSLHRPTGDTNADFSFHISEFYRAYSFVSSRAFLVDQYHGLSMVPIADAFNHAEDNHVHLESDYHVCATCGSVNECVHDELENSPREHSHNHHDEYFEMVMNAPIPPNSEIFNTYGESLTNADLLVRYGFILDVNEKDCIIFSRHEVHDSLLQSSWALKLPLLDLRSCSNSRLIHYIPNARVSVDSSFVVDSDGKVSQYFLAACLLDSSTRIDNGIAHVQDALQNILTLESWQMDNEAEVEVETLDISPASCFLIQKTASAIITMCENRLLKCGKAGVEDFGAYLDNLPSYMHRTRLATTYVIQERSILHSCIAGWQELLEILEI